MSDNETVGSIEFNKPVPVMVAFGIAYSLIFLCGIVGNILVVAVVVTTPCMHTVTNLFISNLAIADVMVAIVCIPLTFLDNISKGWPFGSFLCKVTPYIQGVSVNATAYLLVAIAVDSNTEEVIDCDSKAEQGIDCDSKAEEGIDCDSNTEEAIDCDSNTEEVIDCGSKT
ncbi:Neuropeptide FF receptor 2 [Bulinus truncatus]|nr:Neuropeptide FF receptor 2 [Bulinus truncatus]